MDQFRIFAESSLIYFPFLTLIIGFVGSTHCIGMCGAIALNCSQSKKMNYFYQFGRLSGYWLVAFIVTSVGEFLLKGVANENVTLLASFAIGGGLVFIGLRPYLPLNKTINFKAGRYIYQKLIGRKERSVFTSYLIGCSSIFLPCGLIYGLMVPLMAVRSVELSLLSVSTFWLGTLPMMSMAPYLIQKLLVPLKKKAPTFISICLIFMGVAVISSRVNLKVFPKLTNEPSEMICK